MISDLVLFVKETMLYGEYTKGISYFLTISNNLTPIVMNWYISLK